MAEFKFPVIELVDRYTIARVKHRRTSGANQAELDFYTEQMSQLNLDEIAKELAELEQIHEQIWNMEDDFKKCRVDQAPLTEIGRRAIAIRDLNNHRIYYKNTIAEKTGSLIREIKQYGV